MSHRRVLRFEVPVDDQIHAIADGPVLMVQPWRQATSTPAGRVELWVECTLDDDWPSGDPVGQQFVTVLGTGHMVPADHEPLGSCLDGPLVWHLYAVRTLDLEALR